MSLRERALLAFALAGCVVPNPFVRSLITAQPRPQRLERGDPLRDALGAGLRIGPRA